MLNIMDSINSNIMPKETFLTGALSMNSVNKEELEINDNQNNINNNEENNNVNNSEQEKNNITNNSKNDNRPIGEPPVPTGVDPIDDSHNEFDDFEIEEI